MNTLSKYSLATNTAAIVIGICVLITIAFFSGAVMGAKRQSSETRVRNGDHGVQQIPGVDAAAAAIIKDKNIEEKPKRKFVVLT